MLGKLSSFKFSQYCENDNLFLQLFCVRTQSLICCVVVCILISRMAASTRGLSSCSSSIVAAVVAAASPTLHRAKKSNNNKALLKHYHLFFRVFFLFIFYVITVFLSLVSLFRSLCALQSVLVVGCSLCLLSRLQHISLLSLRVLLCWRIATTTFRCVSCVVKIESKRTAKISFQCIDINHDIWRVTSNSQTKPRASDIANLFRLRFQPDRKLIAICNFMLNSPQ